MSYSLPILGDSQDRSVPRPSRQSAHPRRLVDSYGRTIRDLRLSLTDRCNFRCVYCMEPDVRFARKVHLLTDEELVRLARICHSLGVRHLRLTGGEPALHPTLTELIGDLAAIGFDDLSMTTNGSIGDEGALRSWRDAGLRRLTISIDSLRPDRFRAITRSEVDPGRVIETIRRAQRVGLVPVKVNAVIVRGFNDDEVPALAALAREHAIDVRLIEYMPLDSSGQWGHDKLVSGDEIVDRVEARYPLTRGAHDRESSPARTYAFADGAPGRLGVIASVTRPFCGSCSRLRITADGKIRPCLFSHAEYDVRDLLRGGASDEDIIERLVDATWAKQAGHGISSPGFRQPDRPMSAIGG